MNRSLPQSLLVLLVLGALVAAQQLFALSGGSKLMRAVQDGMHAPWFFVVVLVLYWWFGGYPLVRRVLLVGGIAAALSLGTEFAQSFIPNRSASLGDLVRNAVGGVLGFIFATALMHSTQPFEEPVRQRERTGVLKGLKLVFTPLRLCIALATLVALFVYSVWQPWQELKLKRYRATLLPNIVDFGDERSRHAIEVNEGGSFRLETGSALWPEYEDQGLLSLSFGDSEYPSVYLKEVMQIWVPYPQLVLDVFVLGEDPLALTVGVQYEGSVGTSNYVEKELPAGANRWVIPRNELVPDEATRLRVREVLVYTNSDHAGRSILLGRFFLQNL